MSNKLAVRNPARSTWILIGVLTLLFAIGKSISNR